MTLRRHRADHNQEAIVKALRARGWKVAVTSGVGNGFVDLVAQKGARTVLVEVKREKGKLTADQIEFQQQGWQVSVIRSIDQVKDL